MQPFLIDTHAHIDGRDFLPDFDDMLIRARDAGLTRILTVGADLESSIAAAALASCANIISPPRLMDDVDAVQAQIARTMLESGDWVTARLDGVAYLEKSPLIYWMMAASYRVFGVHDWAARLPLALAV